MDQPSRLWRRRCMGQPLVGPFNGQICLVGGERSAFRFLLADLAKRQGDRSLVSSARYSAWIGQEFLLRTEERTVTCEMVCKSSLKPAKTTGKIACYFGGRTLERYQNESGRNFFTRLHGGQITIGRNIEKPRQASRRAQFNLWPG